MANKNTSSTAETKPARAAEDRVMIIVPKPRNLIGDEECVVGVNGKMYQIKYDKPVSVPKNVADVIKSHLDLQDEIAVDIAAASKISQLAQL